ncbi:MAG: hypothetical protein KAT48_02880 [Bacteroidales bacterium]|nr:hypothetical protein [Bacteroidales bacterium]
MRIYFWEEPDVGSKRHRKNDNKPCGGDMNEKREEKSEKRKAKGSASGGSE